MKKFKVTYIEEVAREVTVVAPSEEEVFKRFKEGNFPFTEGEELNADTRVYSVEEIDRKTYNFEHWEDV